MIRIILWFAMSIATLALLLWLTGSVLITTVSVIALMIIFPMPDTAEFKAIKSRPCSGREWRRTFPQASKDSIRRFMALSCDYFCLDKKLNLLKLRPDDRVGAVFAASNLIEDDLYDFFLRLDTDYGVQLAESRFEAITFGELFDLMQHSGVRVE
jgi:propanediol dehydratase small subunit